MFKQLSPNKRKIRQRFIRGKECLTLEQYLKNQDQNPPHHESTDRF